MENSTLRLIYPQWQGGIISHWIPELNPDDATTGYYLGSQLLNYLAPKTNQEVITVPIHKDIGKRVIQDGVIDRDVIAEQTKAALDIVNIKQPKKIVVLGGECSVSVVPFSYLLHKYQEDVSMIWIDAHPDITLPGDVYAGFHAMAVTALMGLGDQKIISQLPAKFDASKILYVGLRDWERQQIVDRQKELGIPHLSPADVAENSDKVKEWLSKCGTSHVVVHFDMDVLDPAEIIPAVGVSPDGLKIAQVVRIINDIAATKDLVGLTVAEPMPRIAIRLQQMLHSLPLLK